VNWIINLGGGMKVTAVCYKNGSKRLKVSKKFIYIVGYEEMREFLLV